MANETSNRQHAIATFVGPETIAAPFTKRIVNSVGLDGVTRNGPGNYTAQLTEAIGFSGATLRADLPANFLGIAGAQLAPDGGSVLITVFDLSGVPADPPLVGFEVVSVVQGEGTGPAPALPAVPTPPGGGGLLLGWGLSDNAGNLLDQSGAVFAVSVFGLGIFTWTLNPGLAPLKAAVVQIQSGSTSATQVTITNDTTLNASTGASSLAHFVFFYSA